VFVGFGEGEGEANGVLVGKTVGVFVCVGKGVEVKVHVGTGVPASRKSLVNLIVLISSLSTLCVNVFFTTIIIKSIKTIRLILEVSVLRFCFLILLV